MMYGRRRTEAEAIATTGTTFAPPPEPEPRAESTTPTPVAAAPASVKQARARPGRRDGLLDATGCWNHRGERCAPCGRCGVVYIAIALRERRGALWCARCRGDFVFK